MSDIRIYSKTDAENLVPLTGDVIICSEAGFNGAPANSVHLCTNATGPVWKSFANDEEATPFINQYSLEFDGSNSHATIGTDTLFNSTSAFSASFWLNLDTFAGTYPYVASFKSDLTQPFIIGVSQANNYQGIYFGIPTNTVDLSTKSTDISNALVGSWHHFCVTYNGNGVGTDSNYKVYYDGDTNPKPLYGTQGFGSVTNTSYLARASSGYYLDGKLDEISIYNSELTPSNVESLYNGGTAGVDLNLSGLNPLAWWRMGDASGDSYNGTDWTIVNAASGSNSLGSNADVTSQNMAQADRKEGVAVAS